MKVQTKLPESGPFVAIWYDHKNVQHAGCFVRLGDFIHMSSMLEADGIHFSNFTTGLAVTYVY